MGGGGGDFEFEEVFGDAVDFLEGLGLRGGTGWGEARGEVELFGGVGLLLLLLVLWWLLRLRLRRRVGAGFDALHVAR